MVHLMSHWKNFFHLYHKTLSPHLMGSYPIFFKFIVAHECNTYCYIQKSLLHIYHNKRRYHLMVFLKMFSSL